ncbi:hypothetical protein NDU88_001045 [Pleurodeles waltl]|uniref:Uncharacterized protein n=1 Tax=Pleurodeles waltl TaxID=8319 RepID=A0AAV7Q2W4_PLEWA|nr:hypothetical protein NDU88_001045 [Pleurodeles waltl]
MEDRHIIIIYRLNRATIQELCAQLEPDLMSAIRQPTGISPIVQVLSVLHYLANYSGHGIWDVSANEDGPDDGLVAAVEPVDSEEEEAEEEEIDNQNNIMQYFQ